MRVREYGYIFEYYVKSVTSDKNWAMELVNDGFVETPEELRIALKDIFKNHQRDACKNYLFRISFLENGSIEADSDIISFHESLFENKDKFEEFLRDLIMMWNLDEDFANRWLKKENK